MSKYVLKGFAKSPVFDGMRERRGRKVLLLRKTVEKYKISGSECARARERAVRECGKCNVTFLSGIFQSRDSLAA